MFSVTMTEPVWMVSAAKLVRVAERSMHVIGLVECECGYTYAQCLKDAELGTYPPCGKETLIYEFATLAEAGQQDRSMYVEVA